MLVSSADLLEGMLLVRTGRYIIQHFAVISRTRATPYVHNFGTTEIWTSEGNASQNFQINDCR